MKACEVMTAGSVADAARSALAAPPDVLISDLNLYGLGTDGIDALIDRATGYVDTFRSR